MKEPQKTILINLTLTCLAITCIWHIDLFVTLLNQQTITPQTPRFINGFIQINGNQGYHIALYTLITITIYLSYQSIKLKIDKHMERDKT